MTNAIWTYERGDRVQVVDYATDSHEPNVEGCYGTVMKPFDEDSFYVDVVLDHGSPESGIGMSRREFLFTPEEIRPA